MKTSKNIYIPDQLLCNYIRSLIGQFYKILPIKESGEPSLSKYIDSLQRELMGCQGLIPALKFDEHYLSLLAILQYHYENECPVETVRSDIFKAINICKKLANKLDVEGC